MRLRGALRTQVLLVGMAAGSLAQHAVAQAPSPPTAPLPKALSGSWVAVVPAGTFMDRLSVVFDEIPPEAGPVRGRLTLRGVTCGAQDEPLTGTWNGTELRLESRVRPNVNAQRSNGECASGRVTFTLTRKPGETAFEGESRRDGLSTPTQIKLSPES